MRIAHVVHTYYPRFGGIERAVQYLVEAQVKLGHEVTVITPDVDAVDRPKEEVINGVKIIRLRSMKLLYNDLIIPLEKPHIEYVDIVHAHSQNSLFSLMLANKLKKSLKMAVAFYFMAVDALGDHPNLLIRLLGSQYSRRNTKKAIELSDLRLVKGIRDKEVLQRRYGINQVYYLPDAVPNYYFTIEKGNPDEFREKFGIKQEKFFLYIGRIHKLKGPHVLVRSLKYVDEGIAAVFVGPDGGYAKTVLDLAKRIGVRDRVYMLGYISEEEKIHALDSTAALVLPSIADYVETYSIVISEAWARGKPVISSRIGELPYRVKVDVKGLITKPSDPKALADAMLKLLSDDDDAIQRMGKNGRENLFTWNEIATRTIELYKILCGD